MDTCPYYYVFNYYVFLVRDNNKQLKREEEEITIIFDYTI